MDKSYIIRIYSQEKEHASGIVEDVEKCTRSGFNNANQLWSLVTDNKKEQSDNNIIKPAIFNTMIHKVSGEN